MAQIDMIVDFAIKGDEKALIERRLRLHAMCRIHNPQAARTHRDIVSDRDKRIGNVSAMQHACDQTLDSRFAAIPIDGHRYPAHAALKNNDCTETGPQKYEAPVSTKIVGIRVGSLALTVGSNRQNGRAGVDTVWTDPLAWNDDQA